MDLEASLLRSRTLEPGSVRPCSSLALYRLWRWDDVERWFRREIGEEIAGARDEHLLSAINACLELRQQRPSLDAGRRNRLQVLAGL